MQKNFRTYQLAKELYLKSKQIKVRGAVADQLTRASLSIVLNIAEGAGRLTAKDRVRFYSIALGSLQECACLYDLLEREDLKQASGVLKAHLLKLISNPGPDF